MIAGLAEDFELHRSVLLENLAFTEGRVVAADSLATLSGPDARTPNTDLTGVLGSVLQVVPIGLQGGTLQTLVETEELTLIRSPRLRVALSNWLQTLQLIEPTNSFVMDEAQLLIDYLRPRFPFRDLHIANGVRTDPPSSFEPDGGAIPQDLRFANHVSQQWFSAQGQLALVRNLITSADSVLAAPPLTIKQTGRAF